MPLNRNISPPFFVLFLTDSHFLSQKWKYFPVETDMRFVPAVKACLIGNTCTTATVVASAWRGNYSTMQKSFLGQGRNRSIWFMHVLIRCCARFWNCQLFYKKCLDNIGLLR